MQIRSALGVALLLAMTTRGGGRDERAAEGTCPGGTAADPARAIAITRALAGVPEGRRLLAGRDPSMCFAAGPSMIVTGGPLLLDARRPDGTLAARAAHLLSHEEDRALFDGMPRDGAGCEAWVAQVLTSEQRAREVELRVAAALGVAAEPASDLTASYAARCAAR